MHRASNGDPLEEALHKLEYGTLHVEGSGLGHRSSQSREYALLGRYLDGEPAALFFSEIKLAARYAQVRDVDAQVIENLGVLYEALEDIITEYSPAARDQMPEELRERRGDDALNNVYRRAVHAHRLCGNVAAPTAETVENPGTLSIDDLNRVVAELPWNMEADTA